MLSQRRHGFHAVSFVWLHYFTHIFGVFVDVVYWDRIRIIVIGNYCRFVMSTIIIFLFVVQPPPPHTCTALWLPHAESSSFCYYL